jgi:hypothetical protein
LRGDAVDAKVVGVSADRRAGRRCGVFSREPLAQLHFRLFWCRHAAIEDHALGERDRSLGIDILAVDGIAVGEASPDASWIHHARREGDHSTFAHVSAPMVKMYIATCPRAWNRVSVTP